MYTLFDPPPELDALNVQLRNIATDMLLQLPTVEEGSVLPAQTDVAAYCRNEKRALRLVDGNLQCALDGKLLYVFEEGDVVGLEQQFFDLGYSLKSEFAVKVTQYDASDLCTRCTSNPTLMRSLLEHFVCFQRLQGVFIREILKDDRTVDPEIRHFAEGEVIITQGDTPDLVYTLVDGEAEALVDGVSVGTIRRDEIFGMLAVITGTPRTATVVAKTRCMVVGVDKGDFTQLIQHRPATILKLIEDMSRTIVSLNEKVVDLTKGELAAL